MHDNPVEDSVLIVLRTVYPPYVRYQTLDPFHQENALEEALEVTHS